MSERLTEEDLEEMRLKKKWGYGDHFPVLPVTKDIHFLFTQIAALRARAEHAGWEVKAWRPYKYDKELRTLVPEKCLGWLEAVRAERDALRAEVVELGEMLNDALSFTPPSVERWKAMERVVEAARAYLQAEEKIVKFNAENRAKGGTLGPFSPPPVQEKQRLRESVAALDRTE